MFNHLGMPSQDWTYHCGPGQFSGLTPFGAGGASLQDRPCIWKRCSANLTCSSNTTAAGVEPFAFSQTWSSPGGDNRTGSEGGKGQETTAGEVGCWLAVRGVRSQGDRGKQKPYGSLSRASGWQGATASKAEAEEDQGSHGQQHFLGCPLSDEPLLLTVPCRL